MTDSTERTRQMSTEDPKNDLLTEAEYSLKTGWAIPTLRSRRTRGLGAPYIKLGRKIFYRWSSHQAWVLAQERNPTTKRMAGVPALSPTP
jgi:hypothetical protein